MNDGWLRDRRMIRSANGLVGSLGAFSSFITLISHFNLAVGAAGGVGDGLEGERCGRIGTYACVACSFGGRHIVAQRRKLAEPMLELQGWGRDGGDAGAIGAGGSGDVARVSGALKACPRHSGLSKRPLRDCCGNLGPLPPIGDERCDQKATPFELSGLNHPPFWRLRQSLSLLADFGRVRRT